MNEAVSGAERAAVLRAYADRIERGRGTFADYRDEALSARLLVNGSIVTLPDGPQTYIAAPGAPNPNATGPDGEYVDVMTGDDFAEAERVYSNIAERVESWWIDLEDWIIEHLVPLVARATDFDPLTTVITTLQKGNEAIRGMPLALSEQVWHQSMVDFETRLKDAQGARDSLAARRRSGNPSARVPAEQTDGSKLRAEADALAKQVKGLKVGKSLLGGGGLAVEVIAASAEIANGGSWTSATIGGVATLAGGAGIGWVIAATGVVATPVGIVIVVGAGGYAIGELSKALWETVVPLDVREAIDAGDFGYAFS